MPGMVAIDLAADAATVVRAELAPNSRFRITKVTPVPMDMLVYEEEEAAGDEEGLEGEDSSSESEEPETLNPYYNEAANADSTLAVIRGDHVLFHSMSLPFDDPKKVDQVLPFQLQDVLPFDIDNFIVDSAALKKKPTGDYEFLTSIIPEDEVAAALGALGQLGADPKVLTARSATLTGFKTVFPEQLSGSFLLLYTAKDYCALAVYVDDSLKLLREIYLPVMQNWRQIAQQIRCSVARVYHDSETAINRCFVLGQGLNLESIGQGLSMRTQRLDLREIADIDPEIETSLDEIAWALGAFADETRGARGQKGRINFRRGIYAYRPLLQSLVNAFRDQVFYLMLFVVLLFAWGLSSFMTTLSLRSEIDSRILAEVRSALPGHLVPPGSEIGFVEEKLEEIETELEAYGSLSSLTPLESLKELSTAIDRSLNIEVDSIIITRDGLDLKGSVSNYKEIGRLNTLLEERRDRFCEVEVNSREQAFGSRRVKFSADVLLCKK